VLRLGEPPQGLDHGNEGLRIALVQVDGDAVGQPRLQPRHRGFCHDCTGLNGDSHERLVRRHFLPDEIGQREALLLLTQPATELVRVHPALARNARHRQPRLPARHHQLPFGLHVVDAAPVALAADHQAGRQLLQIVCYYVPTLMYVGTYGSISGLCGQGCGWMTAYRRPPIIHRSTTRSEKATPHSSRLSSAVVAGPQAVRGRLAQRNLDSALSAAHLSEQHCGKHLSEPTELQRGHLELSHGGHRARRWWALPNGARLTNRRIGFTGHDTQANADSKAIATVRIHFEGCRLNVLEHGNAVRRTPVQVKSVSCRPGRSYLGHASATNTRRSHVVRHERKSVRIWFRVGHRGHQVTAGVEVDDDDTVDPRPMTALS
jgi:hypothetical protein